MQITPRVVQNILKETLSEKWSPPSADAVQELSSELEALRIIHLSTQASWGEHDKLVARTSDALKDAVAAIRCLHDFIQSVNFIPDTTSLNVFLERTLLIQAAEQRMDYLVRAEAQLQSIRAAPEVAWKSPMQVSNWRHVAQPILYHFRTAMASKNTRPVGVSDKGPAPTFIAKVIPLICGAEVTSGNVAHHLKTSKRINR